MEKKTSKAYLQGPQRFEQLAILCVMRVVHDVQNEKHEGQLFLVAEYETQEGDTPCET